MEKAASIGGQVPTSSEYHRRNGPCEHAQEESVKRPRVWKSSHLNACARLVGNDAGPGFGGWGVKAGGVRSSATVACRQMLRVIDQHQNFWQRMLRSDKRLPRRGSKFVGKHTVGSLERQLRVRGSIGAVSPIRRALTSDVLFSRGSGQVCTDEDGHVRQKIDGRSNWSGSLLIRVTECA